MRIPPEIRGEWSSLRRPNTIDARLRSLVIVRDWIEGTRRHLQATRNFGKDPVILGQLHQAATRGVTSPEFDGIYSSQIRYGLHWWSQPERSEVRS